MKKKKICEKKKTPTFKHNFVKKYYDHCWCLSWMMHMKNTLSELDLHFIHVIEE